MAENLQSAQEKGEQTHERIIGPAIGMRHVQCFLMFIAVGCSFAMRVNLFVGIVPMTDISEQSNGSNDTNVVVFNWSEKTKSYVLSSFFWGYFCTQIPGGLMAQKFGGKFLCLAAVLMSSLLALLTPLGAKLGNWQLLCAIRFAQGLVQGSLYPSTHLLLAKWAPIEERASLSVYCYMGSKLGTILMFSTSGFLASSAVGWPSIFYASGSVGFLWSLAWCIWGANSPSECKHITKEERNYIENSLATNLNNDSKPLKSESKSNAPTPWLEILSSKTFISLLVIFTAQTWGFWLMLTQIPSYMKAVFKMDIKQNALLSSLPYLAMMLLSAVFSAFADIIEKRKLLNLTVSRKLFSTIGQWVPMISIIALGYVRQDQITLAVFLLIVTVGVSSSSLCGFHLSHMDISPNFAGILMGITNCVGNIAGIIAPLLVGHVVTNQSSQEQWRIIFFISAFIYLVGNTSFLLYGTAKVQTWNEPRPKKKEFELVSDKELELEMALKL